jgi:hypothetical protein
MATVIKNIDGLSVAQIQSMVSQGGKFVVFPYTISILVMTFQRSSDIYFIQPGEGTAKYSWGFALTNLVLGWWGFPWGPIYTIGAIHKHIIGGKEVTAEVMPHLIQNDPNANTSTYNVGGNTSQGNNTNSGGYNVPSSGGNNGYNVPR